MTIVISEQRQPVIGYAQTSGFGFIGCNTFTHVDSRVKYPSTATPGTGGTPEADDRGTAVQQRRVVG